MATNMDVRNALEGIAARLQTTGARTVYGEPVTAEGRTIVPVARVSYGFGCGGGSSTNGSSSPGSGGEGAGGGGGVRAVPAGFIEITHDRARFIRFNDGRSVTSAAVLGLGVGVAVARWWSGRTPPPASLPR